MAAKSAEEALADPELDTRVDVAIVDLRLPGMGGWELIDVLRARRPGPARGGRHVVLDADDYPHVEAWLPKPFSGDGVPGGARPGPGRRTVSRA